MSRVSLNRRLEAVLAAAERVNPQAAAVYRMAPATRLRFDAWRNECDRLTDEMGGGEALYSAYLESGEWPLPDPPRAVAEALRVESAPVLTEDMTARDVADVWARMVDA